jgi:hypothetical protein
MEELQAKYKEQCNKVEEMAKELEKLQKALQQVHRSSVINIIIIILL